MLAVLASFIYSAAMNLFVVPVGMYSGGLMGICQVIRTLLVEHLGLSANIDIASIIYFLLNLPLLYFCLLYTSRKQLRDFADSWGELEAMYEFIRGGLEDEQS